MVRATLENLLRPERLNQIFDDAAQRQYLKKLVFSDVVAVMMAVATRTHQSVHASYLAAKQRLGVTSTALYSKLNRLEPGISEALVHETAADAAAVIDAMPKVPRELLPGFEVQFLDGNHLAATEHRVMELRRTRQGPLPGQTLAILDAQRDLITELVLCEDGHAQERSLLPELLERIEANKVIAADRNFCTTKFLFGLVARQANFIIRQHKVTLLWRKLGKRTQIGRIETGVLFEQAIELVDEDKTLTVRRITVKLDKPTESGDVEIHILTNLSGEQATAKQVAKVYQKRWTIESAFQTLTDVLRCEVETLGYPKAALFSFAIAVLAYNTYAVVKAALRSVHGTEKVDEEVSDYHLMHDVVSTHVGMEIAVEESVWSTYESLSACGLAKELLGLAKGVQLSRYPKKKRGPKKTQPRKKSGTASPHIATARVLAKSKRK
ncbi:MAG: transposase [Planctomycetes bacterium]|nr:transposase [Planctomycetota bacterium]